MPYVIRKSGSGYVVKKRFGGQVVGHTETKDKAKAMIAAIYASESRKT